jgi:hypothetical protein
MIARVRAAFDRWVDGYRADREEHWGHPPNGDDEALLRWLRTMNRKLGALHWRRFPRR